MKKIMIAAVTIALAVVAQAASIKWSANTIYTSAEGSTTKAGSTYLALCYIGDASDVDSVVALIKAGNEAAISGADTTKTLAGGLLSSSAVGDYAAGETVSAFAIILDAKTVADANNYMVLAPQEYTFGNAGESKALAWGSQAANTWQSTAAVPEPTSGLLLLLGVAGLALRRRCA